MNLQAIPTMLSMIPSVFHGVDLRDLEKIKTITRQAFPSVPQLSTATLAEWMQQPQTSLLLIDVRSPEEFAVSHLPGARNLRTADQIAKAAEGQGASKTILYCSVGFRSSRLAQALAQQGLREVLNLEGSIFQWANEGRGVYQGNRPVKHIHPFGRRWAGLLKDGLACDC